MLGIDHRLEGLRKLDPDRAERLGRQIIAMLDAEAAYETQRQEAVCRAFSSFDQQQNRQPRKPKICRRSRSSCPTQRE
jgi:hypothetical protein